MLLRSAAPRWALPQTSIRKGVAGAGFQIALEVGCSWFVGEGDLGDEVPRSELGRVRLLAGIVLGKTLFQIFRRRSGTDVNTPRAITSRSILANHCST